jgi:hypothetical protein
VGKLGQAGLLADQVERPEASAPWRPRMAGFGPIRSISDLASCSKLHVHRELVVRDDLIAGRQHAIRLGGLAAHLFRIGVGRDGIGLLHLAEGGEVRGLAAVDVDLVLRADHVRDEAVAGFSSST